MYAILVNFLCQPWGQGEWNGRWSDDSPMWTDEAKSKLAYQRADDGIFWMQIEDFVQSFDEVCSSKVHEEYFYASGCRNFFCITVTSSCAPTNGSPWRGYIKLLPTSTNTQGYVTLSQIDKRTYHNQAYNYSVVRFMLWRGDINKKV